MEYIRLVRKIAPGDTIRKIVYSSGIKKEKALVIIKKLEEMGIFKTKKHAKAKIVSEFNALARHLADFLYYNIVRFPRILQELTEGKIHVKSVPLLFGFFLYLKLLGIENYEIPVMKNVFAPSIFNLKELEVLFNDICEKTRKKLGEMIAHESDEWWFEDLESNSRSR